MIQKKHRFSGQSGIFQANKYGASIRSSQISLRFLDKRNQTPAKVAVVVSKKVSKLAVTRNRIRRVVYEAIRPDLDELKPGFLLVLSVYDEAIKELSPDEVKPMLEDLFSKAGALSKG